MLWFLDPWTFVSGSIDIDLVVQWILYPPPPPLVQARQKSEKRRSDGLMCLDKPVLARAARYQKNVCRQKPARTSP